MNLENDQIREELQAAKAQGEVDEEYFATKIADVERGGARQEKEALATYGMLEGSDLRIAPLRRALAVRSLAPDDFGFLSIHGTSTGANERNETHLEQCVHSNLMHARKHYPDCRPEEPRWSPEGWVCCLADDRPPAVGQHWNHP